MINYKTPSPKTKRGRYFNLPTASVEDVKVKEADLKPDLNISPQGVSELMRHLISTRQLRITEFPDYSPGGGGTTSDPTARVYIPRDYLTIQDALDAHELDIFILNGVYHEHLEIRDSHTLLQGESRDGVIIRPIKEKNALNIYSSHCTVRNLTLDCETNSSQACLVVGDGRHVDEGPDYEMGNFNLVEGCKILGSDHTFAVYLAGFSVREGAETLDAYFKNELQQHNTFRDNLCYSQWAGDSFSFSLQKFLVVEGNTFFGGRIAYYMCNESVVKANFVRQSIAEGIFIGSPMRDCQVVNNVIESTRSNCAALKFMRQLEHVDESLDPKEMKATRVSISFNQILSSDGNGIEVAGDSSFGTFHEDCSISFNTITGCKQHGVYIQSSRYFSVNNNSISECGDGTNRGSAIYLVDRVTDSQFCSNTIVDLRDRKMHCAIGDRETSNCSGNNYSGNTIQASNRERTVWITSDGCRIQNNHVEGGSYAGILCEGSKCSISGNVLEGNNIENIAEIQIKGTKNLCIGNVIGSTLATTNPVLDEGSENVVRDNIV